jgi:hypothetical protein
MESLMARVQKLSIDPTGSRYLQHGDLLKKHLFLEESLDDIRACVRRLSIEDPLMSELLIVAPFIVQFGEFVRHRTSYNRWPTLGETCRGMQTFLDGYVDSDFLSKKSRLYTVRKYAEKIPEWSDYICSRSGALKSSDRILDISSLVGEYVDYLVNGLYINSLDSFANYIFDSMFKMDGSLQKALVRELILGYRQKV